jgi:hypothetical protein
MEIEVSVGEIVDKLSILRIKKNNITDPDKLKNISAEYEYLHDIVFNVIKIDDAEFYDLVLINEMLWDIEDKIRIMEFDKQFDDQFVALASNVYTFNDKRAELKKQINIKYKSKFVEEKSYEKY